MKKKKKRRGRKEKMKKETTRLKEAEELRHDLEQESSIEDRDLHV